MKEVFLVFLMIVLLGGYIIGKYLAYKENDKK